MFDVHFEKVMLFALSDVDKVLKQVRILLIRVVI